MNLVKCGCNKALKADKCSTCGHVHYASRNEGHNHKPDMWWTEPNDSKILKQFKVIFKIPKVIKFVEAATKKDAELIALQEIYPAEAFDNINPSWVTVKEVKRNSTRK